MTDILRKVLTRPLSRRAFLGVGAAAVAGTGLFAGLGIHPTTSQLEVVAREVKIKNLPAAFSGFRIGFLTDSHLGRWVRSELIADAVEAFRQANIDLLLLGGDYLWIPDSFPRGIWRHERNHRFDSYSDNRLAAAIYAEWCDLLEPLKPAAGRFAVYGNHDLWVAPVECTRALSRNGLTLLTNKSSTVERGGAKLIVAGVDDYWTGAPRFPLPERRSSPDEIRIMVSHNPDFAVELIHRRGVDLDLALCGHTHGGQIRLPLVGAPFYNVYHVAHAVGLTAVKNTQIYTSRGLGVVEIPLRVNCRPEATILTLV